MYYDAITEPLVDIIAMFLKILPNNFDVSVQIIEFLEKRYELIMSILRDQSIITISSLKQLNSVTLILSKLIKFPQTAQREMFGRFQDLMLQLIYKYCHPERWQNRLKIGKNLPKTFLRLQPPLNRVRKDPSLEAIHLSFSIISNILSYCRAISFPSGIKGKKENLLVRTLFSPSLAPQADFKEKVLMLGRMRTLPLGILNQIIKQVVEFLYEVQKLNALDTEKLRHLGELSERELTELLTRTTDRFPDYTEWSFTQRQKYMFWFLLKKRSDRKEIAILYLCIIKQSLELLNNHLSVFLNQENLVDPLTEGFYGTHPTDRPFTLTKELQGKLRYEFQKELINDPSHVLDKILKLPDYE